MAKSPLGRGLGALLGGTTGVSAGTAWFSSPVVRSEEGERIVKLPGVEDLTSASQQWRFFEEVNLR